jgi:hypothetical protein
LLALLQNAAVWTLPGIWSAYVAWIFDIIHLEEDIRKEFPRVMNPNEWLAVVME